MADTPDLTQVKTSTRDLAVIQQRLTIWMEKTLGAGSEPKLSEVRNPGTGGMSSETLLFDMHWKENGVAKSGAFVGRLPPAPDAHPVFPKYDFPLQVGVMRLVEQRSQVPVPKVLWDEPCEEALGMPFFIMSRARGEPLPDLPPYPFDGWLLEGTAEQQKQLQDSCVAMIAGIHGVKTTPAEVSFLMPKHTNGTMMRRIVDDWKDYYDWAREGLEVPLITEMMAWLEAHWPEGESASVINWGDARPGNILWENFEPKAVLDWEMAVFGPREMDVAWLIFFHKYFQYIALGLGFPEAPMQGYMTREAIVAEYERLTGTRLQNIDWYLGFSVLRMAMFDVKVSKRALHFGERQPEEDTNNYLFTREIIRKILRGEDPWNF
ncbi:MAG: phosphotransferase family protein [Sterolibacterium sp.]|jgi:aminoglycoside phosphotransferase (APT) family kinase protein|nr:phosphotransferase family protein [Sterolibacterium sp.]